MSMNSTATEYAVIGAGPYGMAIASHLREAGLDVRVFGKVMDFWATQMPRGMKLRSPLEGSHIADPHGACSLHRFGAERGVTLEKSLPLADFVAYGRWFQTCALPDLDSRNVSEMERSNGTYRLTLEDGERLQARNVIVATGIGSFAHVPAPFVSLPHELVSHTSDRNNQDLSRFAGRRVAVVGSGQSALESAALLMEAGAEVEVIARQPHLRYLKDTGIANWIMDRRLYPFKAPGRIGPIGMNWLIEHPRLFTLFPRRLQDWMTRRAIRPAGSSWLRPRNEGVRFRMGCHAVAASVDGNQVRLQLSDGSVGHADHVLLGTGYKIDIARYPFWSGNLLQAIRTADGYPLLNGGFESSLPGLYFVGTTAAHSFGPLCRFVAGTPFTARTLARYARKKSLVVAPSASNPLPRRFVSAAECQS